MWNEKNFKSTQKKKKQQCKLPSALQKQRMFLEIKDSAKKPTLG